MVKTLKRMLVFALAVCMAVPLAACSKNEEIADASYTYNIGVSVFPTNWSPFMSQTVNDSEILDYISEGFYSFDYNDTKDNYKLIPQAAAKEPVDVTAEYAGKFGIKEGDTAKAWKIELRDDLMWEDGTKITAQDYVTSAKLLLDPIAKNHRADNLYSGNLQIVNAKNYLNQSQDEKMDFSEVGIFAPSETELVLVLEKPLEGFYLLYALTSSWLVNEELYKQCESIKDGVYHNSYGTSVDTTISYGPYKLTAFQSDKQYVLTRNEHHHDVKEGFYKTTAIQVDYIAEASTRLEYFLKGDLDTYGLTAEDVESYQSSDYTYYTDSESTWFVALNPSKEALEKAQAAAGANVNKTILTIKEFRQALAYALDRNAFSLVTNPTSGPAFGVFSDQIISDPEEGTSYRSTEEAKWVLADFWGLTEEIGEGKLYETIDDAIASITGYNLEKAKQLFDVAYDKAIAEGLMDADDIIEIKVGIPNSSSTAYSKGYEFLSNGYTEAVKGTKLEGKLRFTLDDTLGNGFGNALRANQVDLLFYVGWSGSALDPYGLMEAYTTEEYQYNPSWDTKTVMCTVELDGKNYTASVLDWTYAMNGTEITITAEDGSKEKFSAGTADKNPQERFAVLTALEGAILETYQMIPLNTDASANLKGMQIQYYTEEHVYGIGRGGMKYMEYNYSDAQWAEYVQSQGGKLKYN